MTAESIENVEAGSEGKLQSPLGEAEIGSVPLLDEVKSRGIAKLPNTEVDIAASSSNAGARASGLAGNEHANGIDVVSKTNETLVAGTADTAGAALHRSVDEPGLAVHSSPLSHVAQKENGTVAESDVEPSNESSEAAALKLGPRASRPNSQASASEPSRNNIAHLENQNQNQNQNQNDSDTQTLFSDSLDLGGPHESVNGSIEISEFSNMAATSHGNSGVENIAANRSMNPVSEIVNPDKVTDQLTKHIVSARQSLDNGEAELEVALDPPELGRIKIQLTSKNEQLDAKLFISEGSTAELIRDSLSGLLDSLSEAGIQFDGFQLENSSREPQEQQPAEHHDLADVEQDDSSANNPRQPHSTSTIDILVK